jgi:cytochrome c oxidase subunit 2
LASHPESRAGGGTTRRGVQLAVSALLVTGLLSGCGEQIRRGFLPSTPDTTNQTGRIMNLWNGSWIAALAVGVLVWGLILWCVVVYRRRRNETGFPAQVRYHLPLEILYTIVPLMMVAVLFYYTARDQAAIADTSRTPDVRVHVVAKQWSWDFNYVDDGVYETGVQADLTGEPGVERELPTLYLPVNERVEFVLTSRDVIHSFWIPAFLYKLDAIPGITNTFQVVPQRVGTYQGKCAELCGEYHASMLFNVRVVPRDVYEAHLAELRARGQVGKLATELGQNGNPSSGAGVDGNPVDSDGTGRD